MARRSFGPLIDSAFFPEIVHEPSKYESPLTAILSEQKRKHVSAAVSTAPNLSGNNDDTTIQVREEIDIFSKSDECNCHLTKQTVIAPRRASLFQSKRRDSLGSGRTCPACGKRLAFDPIGDTLMNRSPKLAHRSSAPAGSRGNNSGRGGSSVGEPDTRRSTGSGGGNTNISNVVRGPQESGGMGPPQHVQALLETTPHLRHLSQASTDMQGIGNLPNPRSFFGFLLPGGGGGGSNGGGGNSGGGGVGGIGTNSRSGSLGLDSNGNGGAGMSVDYRTSLARQAANQKAASELTAFLSILAHEMSLESYGAVENEVFTAIFALIHSNENSSRVAGVAGLDALIEAPSADEENKAIMFANKLSSSLRVANSDFQFLSAVAGAFGHMAVRVANVDFVEYEVTGALEWIRSNRSDRR